MDDNKEFLFSNSKLNIVFHTLVAALCFGFVLLLPLEPEARWVFLTILLLCFFGFWLEQRHGVVGLVYAGESWTVLRTEQQASLLPPSCAGARKHIREAVELRVAHVTPLAMSLVLISKESSFSRARRQRVTLWVDQLSRNEWQQFRSLAFIS